MWIFLSKYVLQYYMICSSTVVLYGVVLYPLYILAIGTDAEAWIWRDHCSYIGIVTVQEVGSPNH